MGGKLLSGKTALITGSGGNLGTAIVRTFLEQGAKVVGHTGRKSLSVDTKSAIDPSGERFFAFSGDLSRDDAADSLLHDAQRVAGQVDILVNCAATQVLGSIAEQSLDEWSRVQEVNCASVFALSRCVANAGSDGSIVNVASIEAVRPNVHHAAYAASKAAVVSLTKSLAVEYGPKGWRANAVAPGLIHRPGLEREWPEGVARWKDNTPLGRTVNAEEVAQACLFLVSLSASAVNGVCLPVDCGFLASSGW